MTDDPSRALKALREGLRGPIPDITSLLELVETALREISLVAPGQTRPDLDQVERALHRYLPSIQLLLLSDVIPAIHHALEDAQLEKIVQLFTPTRYSGSDKTDLRISRWIALSSYLTLPTLLNAARTPPLPPPSRAILFDILDRLSRDYGIDEMYRAVWGSLNTRPAAEQGKQRLMWDEVVRDMTGLPSKCANAAGRWKGEGWAGDLPDRLEVKPYLENTVRRLETLMYELSMAQPAITDVGERIRTVIQRLAALGMLSNTSTSSSRQPSFVPPLLPGLLAHLHPPPESPLPSYPPTFLPSVLLPLPTSILASLVTSLLRHLSFNLLHETTEPDQPSATVHRLVEITKDIIGPAVLGEEAWMAMLRCVTGRAAYDDPWSSSEHFRTRTIVGWVRTGSQIAAKAFLDSILGIWTDPKSIKFALFSQQFHLTHLLLLSMSLLPPYHPHLVAISHRGEFLIAVQSFLSHPDPKIRRLGMLVAETVSALTIRETAGANGSAAGQDDHDEIEELKAGLEADEEGSRRHAPRAPKRLKFDAGMWDGEGEGREECRWLRRSVGVNDLSAKLDDEPGSNAWLLGWTETDQSSSEETADTTSSRRPPQRGRSRVAETHVKGPSSSKPIKSKSKPQPKIVMLDADQEADPLQGYEPASPSSSRSPSPTPSYLEEVAADPTLALDSSQKKKVTRPVYVQQLIALLKEREKPEHIEMGLKWGEGLVRAKRSFGTELSENAVNVALVTLALNDPFHLDDFEERRQGLLNALVACAPKQVAPFLSEQYFNGQYSLQQKSVLLTSLAMGARELANLSVPQPMSTTRRLDFPTKTLPPALHQKYIGPNDIPPGSRFEGQLEDAIGGVRDLMLCKGAKRGEETVPELAREKRLRVGASRTTKIAELGSLADRQMAQRQETQQTAQQTPVVPFQDVAAEYFIMPLINRFWQHYQDSAIRESRAISTGDRYRGAGTGMVLAPMALEKLLMTLSLLLHAARHSPVFLSILAPEALELGVTIGARHLPSPSNDPFLDSDAAEASTKGSKLEAQVLAAALELVLVALDTSVELDKGRTLAMDKPELVLATGEWATGVFEVENKGGQVSAGQGGMREGRVKATAAGVVVKIGEIGERWISLGRMMR